MLGTGLLLGSLLAVAASDQRIVGDFADGLAEWDERSFVGNTRYRAVELDGRMALQAVAEGSASALYRRIEIDLAATPCLTWSWRIAGTFADDIDETSRSGDDYPARIYVVRRGGLAFWRTRALNYVWSSARPVGSRWPNAYAGDNVQMMAVDTGESRSGEWVRHGRDVRADWLAAFGENIDSLDGIAVMTDADDTGGTARSWYADIRFSAPASGHCSGIRKTVGTSAK